MSSELNISDPVSVEDQGRTFQGYRKGKYILPNDGHEQERLDFLHALWLLLMKGALSWAPLARVPARVLDLGTGTGIWANQFAEKHPEAEVMGIDLSLIQPPVDQIPPNCKFFRKDAEEPWNFGSASELVMFDLIHLRNMATCFEDPKAIVGKAFQNLAPGGWVEYQEWSPWGLYGADESMDERLRHSAMMRYQEIVAEGAARIGRDVKLVPRLKEWLAEAGFVDVVERRILCPNNPWPSDPEDKLIGRYAQVSAFDGMEAASVKICPIVGMTAEQTKELMGEVRKEMMDETLRAYYAMYVVYGRKLGDATQDKASG